MIFWNWKAYLALFDCWPDTRLLEFKTTMAAETFWQEKTSDHNLAKFILREMEKNGCPCNNEIYVRGLIIYTKSCWGKRWVSLLGIVHDKHGHIQYFIFNIPLKCLGWNFRNFSRDSNSEPLIQKFKWSNYVYIR